MLLTRRALMIGVSAFVPCAASSRPSPASEGKLDQAVARLAALEAKAKGRLGVCVLDTGTGRRLDYRSDERFPMCSTFKLLAVAAILKRVDEGRESLSRPISFGKQALLDYAPITKAHLAQGAMPVSDLCAAAIEWSDNSAANLLLGTMGGPSGVTAFARSLGDEITRLDRTEPTLNTAIPGELRDTSTPAALIADVDRILLGSELSVGSRQHLQAWLLACKTDAKRLRAGLPPSWRMGDKTGSGENGTANTLAILFPPQGAPLLAGVYLTASEAPQAERDAVHAEVGRIIVEAF